MCEEGGRYLLLEACCRFFRPELSSQIHYQLHGLGKTLGLSVVLSSVE